MPYDKKELRPRAGAKVSRPARDGYRRDGGNVPEKPSKYRGRRDDFPESRRKTPDNGRKFPENRRFERGGAPRPVRPPRPPKADTPFGRVETDPLARLMSRAPENEAPENLLVGRNPIREAIKAGRDLEKLMVARGDLSGSAREIVAKAREAGIVVQEVDRSRLDAIYPNHQGMIAFASSAAYADMDDIFARARERGEDPFVVVLDGITDPHNLGAIIRTAECAGCHGVIIPERRSVGLTPAAVKASAGACEYMAVVRVTNVNRTLDELKDRGLWILGADTEGEDALTSDLTGPVALVIGAEGEGIAPLTRGKCDRMLSLPMAGHIDSLNASVAAGILMYAVMGARRG